ncbi:hypothetical protein BH10BAC2_BH10BAC2_20610 [soil metagenome]
MFFFRARISSEILNSREDMFHIPFQMREKITNQRFSLPGTPCLYLSNNTYTCWEGLDRENISKLNFSKFRMVSDNNRWLNWLDITTTPQDLKTLLESFEKVTESNLIYNEATFIGILNFIMKYPLMLCCSICVKFKKDAFKPEYIFPQFLMQWVRENKSIDGIKYSSVSTYKAMRANYSSCLNYAFPTKDITDYGYCKRLVKFFEVSEPLTWEILNMMNANYFTKNVKSIEHIKKVGLEYHFNKLELIQGKQVEYKNSIFGKIEDALADLELQHLE